MANSQTKELKEQIKKDAYFIDKMRQENIAGVSCTIPHKESIIPYLDQLSDTARSIGAVNTIVKKNDVLYGDPKSNYGQHFRGSLFAVYDFFERQGCGWYGPDPLWQIVPKVEKLSSTPLAIEEIPAFKWRRIWMSGLPPQSP